MKHTAILLLSILILLLASACTVMAPLENVIPASGESLPENPLAETLPVETLPVETLPAEASPQPVKTEDPLESNAAQDGAVSQPSQGEGTGSANAPAPGSISDEQFDAQLAQAIQAKDFAALRASMGSQFVLAGWRSEGAPLSPEDAVAQLGQSALAPGATPAASFNVDPVPLLDFADPLKFFPPDAVRAFFVDSVGPSGADEALVIIGRDPASGQRYWKGLLVALGGFRQDDGGKTDLNQFSALLAQSVEQRDFSAMRGLMRDRFSIATFNATLFEFGADEALDKLRGGIFAPGSAPAMRPGTDVAALLSGRDPLGEWGPIAQPVRALHLMGLGSDGGGEAVLVIGRDPASGQLYWHGVLLPPNGRYFRADDVSDDVLPTDVRYVMALEDINMRTGPGLNYAVEGKVFAGQIAQVTGRSRDLAWWQVDCPQDASGRCWVSARTDLTQPTSAP